MSDDMIDERASNDPKTEIAGGTHPKRRSSWRLIILLSTVSLSCIVLLSVLNCGGEEVQPEEWGYESIQVFERIEVRDTSYSIELNFRCDFSTDRFDMRLLYPMVEYEFGDLGDDGLELLKSAHGFEFALTTNTGSDTLASYVVRYDGSYRGHLMYSSPGLPLGLWLGGGIRVSPGEQYTVRMTLPPRRSASEQLGRMILIGGYVGPVFP